MLRSMSATAWEQVIDSMIDAVKAGDRPAYMEARRKLVIERQGWLALARYADRPQCRDCERKASVMCAPCIRKADAKVRARNEGRNGA